MSEYRRGRVIEVLRILLARHHFVQIFSHSLAGSVRRVLDLNEGFFRYLGLLQKQMYGYLHCYCRIYYISAEKIALMDHRT